MEKTIEIPQLQTIEKIVDIPEVLHEFDEEDRHCDDPEEICNVARMSRKRKESVETVL